MRQSQQKSPAFSSAEMFKSLYGKQCDPDQTGSTVFASILNLSVMLGNFLQQATSADAIFRCIFFLGALRVKHFKLA